MPGYILLVLIFIFVTASSGRSFAGSRSKTDVVYMRNGDKITCEIRSLEQGQLTVKPDYTNSTIVIDWNSVDHIESSQTFIVSEPDGTLHTGTISGSPDTRAVVVETKPPVVVDHQAVIQIEPLGTTFLKRLRGNFDAGLSFARSNGQKDLSLDASLIYQSEKHLFSFDSNSQFNSQQKANDTNETSVKTGLFQQLQRSNWYAGGFANFLTSSEQQLTLRTTLGGGLAKRLIFTNRTDLRAVGALGYTVQRDEPGTTSAARANEFDSAFSVQYSTYRFDSTTFDTAVWVYPSLVEPGRVRMTFNQDMYYKFLGDFYIRLSFYDNFDNQPVIGAPGNNLGGSTTLGWSFR